MAERFTDEAKKLFELECGRASLPSVFGLYILFFVSAMMGKDRAGLMYRYMVCPPAPRDLPSLLSHPHADQSTGTAHAQAVASGKTFR